MALTSRRVFFFRRFDQLPPRSTEIHAACCFGSTTSDQLAYLRRFPIDKLKIDRSFIAGLGGDQDEATIVSTVVGMAHSLHLGVIAEGVETQEQFDFLRELECDEVQGHLFSSALPPEEFAQKIAGWVCPP